MIVKSVKCFLIFCLVSNCFFISGMNLKRARAKDYSSYKKSKRRKYKDIENLILNNKCKELDFLLNSFNCKKSISGKYLVKLSSIAFNVDAFDCFKVFSCSNINFW